LEKLDEYIPELLERHDCVIIPDFGGFLLNTMPAGFLGGGNEIHPPSKVVSFNRSLNLNDGLLAMYISEKEGIAYNDALLKIAGSVNWMRIQLNAGQKLHFSGIGDLLQNNEDKIIFTPDYSRNYFVSSFGLPLLLLQPVEKQSDSKILQLREKKVRPLQRERKPVHRSYAPMVSIAASLIVMLFVFFKNYPIDSHDLAMAVFRGQAINTPLKTHTQVAEIQKINTPVVAYLNPNLTYYIVGGSFKKESNAKTFVEKLKKKGFQAQVLNTENGFFRVTYYREKDSTRADEVLHKIKVNENQSAWLLKW
jgi:hypothetical protein